MISRNRNIYWMVLEMGFSIGSSLTSTSTKAKNHFTVRQFPTITETLIKKELEAKRYAGPFKEVPFQNFHVSPLKLTQKSCQGNTDSYRIYRIHMMRNQLTMLFPLSLVLLNMLQFKMLLISFSTLVQIATWQSPILSQLPTYSSFTKWLSFAGVFFQPTLLFW